MAAPTNAFSTVTLAEIQAGKPCKQELKEAFRGNNLRAFEVLLAAGVAPGDAAVAIGHRHRGAAVDGTATVASQPQENLIAGSDNVAGWSVGLALGADLRFDDISGGDPLYQIVRGKAGNVHAVSITKAFVSANIVKKIKSAGGKGRFTCSMHMKRVAAAAGVVGGTLRFGIYTGAAFAADAFIDIDFDDVTQEYKRFYFTSDQIARPAALNLRAQWVAHPSDWDTIGEEDLVGYNGGYMVTNGGALAKWDISHLDGGGDSYDADANNLFYWWDEIITEVEQTV